MAVEESPPPPAVLAPRCRRQRYSTDKHGRRLEVYNEVLARLRDLGEAGGRAAPAEISPAFEDALWAHFHRLPVGYALDVNSERTEDVVTHQRQLEQARDPLRRLALSVRVVQVIEHKPYDHKAEVFSFGIVLWELLTGKIPYEYLTPLQAAIGVVQKVGADTDGRQKTKSGFLSALKRNH